MHPILSRVRHLTLPVAVLTISLLSTAAVSVQFSRTTLEQDRARFDAAVDNLHDTLTARIETYVAMLRAGAGMLAATDLPTAGEFNAFVERLGLQRNYPGIQGIGYTARITPALLDTTIAAQLRTGRGGFRIWPEHPRDEYHAILYLEPLDRRNAAAIGYDMFTETTRRVAMERARDSGDAAASGLVTLVQEIDEAKQPGFLIYVPVYEGGRIPTTLEERRARLRGFVYSPFRAGDLFAGILGRHPYPRAGFELFDGSRSDDALVYRTGQPEQPRFTTERQIDVAGRQWIATVFSTPHFDAGSPRAFFPFVLWGGVAISMLLTGLTLLQARARAHAEESEEEAAMASRSLQQQAETLRLINRTGAQLAGELDLDRLVQAVTDASTTLTRAQIGVFFFNSVNELGESSTLYALSGVPREAFADLPMPRSTAIFGATSRGAEIIRSDDITVDPRYGKNAPHHGTPAGHLPVRSYLAVPVRSRSGEVLGGLFFGHADAGVFTEHSEQLVTGIAAQAAIAIDNARLYGRVQQLLGSERAARAEAERVSRTKDEFLAVLSHELRTPLNAVMGWAHLLHSGALPDEKYDDAIDSILRNARAQSRLIEDLLDMSRIISGRLSLELTALDVRDVIESAVNVVRPSAAAKGIELSTRFPETPAVVSGDAGRLQQVVWNLLTNAIKFTAAGGHVRVEVAILPDTVEIAVIDDGAGITPEFVPHVFDRFRQADASFTRGHGGLGLGLSIVRSLVELHNGVVRAASDGVGRGAIFTVLLPRVSMPVANADRTQRSHASSNPPHRALDARIVLVVEDDKDGREMVAEVLRQQGAEVLEASSGQEALAMLRDSGQPPDLVISDVGMPGMDGYEFIRHLRALAATYAAVPAIALTAYAGNDDRARALAAGYNTHLPKPFSPAALVSISVSLATGTALG